MSNFTTILLAIFFLISFRSEGQIWDIGTTWIYETENFVNREVSYATFEIIDTMMYNNENVWLLSTPDGDKMMKQDNGRVWLYQEELQDFQLTYDFNSTSNYAFKWGTICPDSIDGSKVHQSEVYVDSIRNITLPDQTISEVQYISYEEKTNVAVYGMLGRQTLKNIGFLNNGLGLNTGYLTCDNYWVQLTRLRCFSNDSVNYQFVDYACDSTWFSTSIPGIESAQINLYPNPTSGIVRIDLPPDWKEGTLLIHDMMGRLVYRENLSQVGKTKELDLNRLNEGVYRISLIPNQVNNSDKLTTSLVKLP